MRLENRVTGEIVTVVSASDPELLVLETEWPRPGRRAAPHVHPAQEERFTVLSGEAALRAGDEETVLRQGESFAVPPGVPHLAWNPTDDPVRLRLEFRPALRWLEFVERVFALEPGDSEGGRALLEEYGDVVRPAEL